MVVDPADGKIPMQAWVAEKRKQIYWKLEEVLYNSYEDAWLWWEETATAYRKQIEGWDQEGFLKYRDAWFWAHPLWFKDGKA